MADDAVPPGGAGWLLHQGYLLLPFEEPEPPCDFVDGESPPRPHPDLRLTAHF